MFLFSVLVGKCFCPESEKQKNREFTRFLPVFGLKSSNTTSCGISEQRSCETHGRNSHTRRFQEDLRPPQPILASVGTRPGERKRKPERKQQLRSVIDLPEGVQLVDPSARSQTADSPTLLISQRRLSELSSFLAESEQEEGRCVSAAVLRPFHSEEKLPSRYRYQNCSTTSAFENTWK